jgi:NAD(P)-dependent dehydrogenase (short-subunit alcohol dehydrogenase family)
MASAPSVIVIGASRGIGFEFVRQYAADGARVVGTARSEQGLQRLRDAGAKALALDVTDPASCAGLAWSLDGERFDIAIVNAGVIGPRIAAPQAPTPAQFDDVMHTNVLGPMQLLPVLTDVLAPGARLAVISSRMGSMGLRTNGGNWLYRASKAALNSVLKDASFALGERAVCVALHPGWVRTDMGGADADLEVGDAVAAMRRTIAGLMPQHSGSFFNFDGQPLAW